jgi:crotonobetainyl-CoA:carnitine CoA-transferase CaiB-like acyl-CoA transferase
MESPLARFLRELGADVTRCDTPLSAPDIAAADLLLENLGLARIGDVGLSRAQIEAANPRLIHVSVSTFGSRGPRRHWRGSELVASAMGGVLRLVGDVDRPPVKEALDACGFHADMVAAVGALAALADRRRSGVGQHVDVATQEVAFSRNVNGVLVWQFDRQLLGRAGGALNYGRATVRCIWALRDGYCFHSLMTGRFGAPANQGLSDWMDECRADNPLAGVDWNTYNRSTLDPATRARWESAIAAFFETRTRAEIAGEGQRRGINATVVAAPADVRADPHLEARGFWRDTPAGREPGRFLRVLPAAQPSLPQGPAARRRGTRTAGRRPRAGFFLGAGRLHHHQDARRSRRRSHQARVPYASLPVAPRRAGRRFTRGQSRRQAVVLAPQHLETQPVPGSEAAGEPRAARAVARLGRRRGGELLARHAREAGPRLSAPGGT